MKGEINLLPRSNILLRERSAYLAGIGRFMQRISMLLLVLIVGEALVYGAFLYIGRIVDEPGLADKRRGIIVGRIQGINGMLVEFETREESHNKWSLFIEDVLKVIPGSVVISEMGVKEKLGVMEIDGSSSSRPAILDFQNLLKELDWVDTVEAPLQNYAIGPEAGFSFSLMVKEEL